MNTFLLTMSVLPLLLNLRNSGYQLIPTPPQLIKSDCEVKSMGRILGCINYNKKMVFWSSDLLSKKDQDETFAHEFAHSYFKENPGMFKSALVYYGNSENVAENFAKYYTNPEKFSVNNPIGWQWFNKNMNVKTLGKF